MTNRQRALFYALEAVIDHHYNEIGLAMTTAEIDPWLIQNLDELRNDHIDRIRREAKQFERTTDAIIRHASEMERAGL